MPNLPVNSAFIIPNTQLQNDFPPRGTAVQFEPKESSFSKFLKEAVQANQFKRQAQSQLPKREKPLATDSRPRMATPAGEEQPKLEADAKEDAKPEDNSDGQFAQKGDQREAKTAQLDREGAEKTKATKEEGKEAKTEETAMVDNLVLSLLATESQVDYAAVESGQVDGQLSATVAGLTSGTDSISPASSGIAPAQLGTANGDQKSTASAGLTVKAPEDGVGVQQVVDGLAENQIAANLNQPMVTLAKQSDIAAHPEAANRNLAGLTGTQALKPGMTEQKENAPANQDVLAKTSATRQGEAGKAQPESGVKPVFNISISGNALVDEKSGSGLKGQFQSFNAQDINADQTIVEAPVRAASDAEKQTPIDMRLIQTQLSINSKTDKVRADLPVDFSTSSNHHIASGNAEATGTTQIHVNKEELFSQIVERVKVMVNNGHSEMEVSLKPDHLGKLQLKVSVENQVVTAKFVAESQQVKEIIETNLSQLRQNMHDAGIKVDQLLVTVGQQNNGGNFQEAAGNQGRFSNQNSSGDDGRQDFEGMENGTSSEKQASRETLIDLIA